MNLDTAHSAPRRLAPVALAALVGLLMTAGPALADDPKVEASSPSAGQNHLQIWIDPDTGRLTRTRPRGVAPLELSAREVEMLRRDDSGVDQRPLPGGGYIADVSGRFRHMSTVTVDENGKLRGDCAGLPHADHDDHTDSEGSEDVR